MFFTIVLLLPSNRIFSFDDLFLREIMTTETPALPLALLDQPNEVYANPISV